MAVGVAQNAGPPGRLRAMSEIEGVHGRSCHDGAKEPRPDALLHGYNFAEQQDRSLKIDPKFLFITGWSDWVARRLSVDNGRGMELAHSYRSQKPLFRSTTKQGEKLAASLGVVAKAAKHR